MKNKLKSMVATATFIRENKNDLMKNLPAYEHLLHVFKKAVDKYDRSHGDDRDDEPDYEDEQGQEDQMIDGEPSDDGDAADQWLKQHQQNAKDTQDAKTLDARASDASAKETDSGKKVYSKPWEPMGGYSPQQDAAIKQHLADGYSHREAERLSGVDKGPADYKSAMQSGIHPSEPSDKMMGHLKGMAKEWLDGARSRDLSNADSEKNPMKHAAGQMEQAHTEHVADYNKAHSDFLASDAIKGLDGGERHAAIKEWKNQWKSENPNYDQGLDGVAAVQGKYAEAAKIIGQKGKEIQGHIARGGSSEMPDMTTEEAMQHLGGGKTDEGYTQGNIIQDPTANFAAKNPRLVELLSQKDGSLDRMKRVDSASAIQGKVRLRKQPAPAAPAAPTASVPPKESGE